MALQLLTKCPRRSGFGTPVTIATRNIRSRNFATIRHFQTTQQYDEEFDVVVVGSGAGGLTAAITATLVGKQKVLVTEKSKWFGGTSAFSGGALWVPMSRHTEKDTDSIARAKTYIQSYLQKISRMEDYDDALVSAYLETAPEMVEFLESSSAAQFVPCATPDYYMELEGAVTAGRTILNAPYDGRRLGSKLVKQVRYPLQGYCAFGSMQADALDFNAWTHPFSNFRNLALVTGSVLRYMVDRVRYGKGTNFCNGNALVGRLLESATRSGIEFRNEAAAIEPILADGRIMGVVIDRHDGPVRVRAKKAVILATGGFARNGSWARKFLPAGSEWTVSPRSNQGDGIQIGLTSGGVLPKPLNENAALWSPVSEIKTRKGPRIYPHFVMGLTKPGSIIVDVDARRFANESASYQDFGKAVQAAGVQKQYLIGTKAHLRKYGMGAALPAPYPINHLVRQGYLVRAPTISGLATKIGLDPRKLTATVEKFNKFAREGKDPDFHRGEAGYDRAFGDPSQPNPCLGPLEHGPFYAISMHAGNGITMYGLKTNQDAQVLDSQENPVPGLYAVGADSNHFLRGHYPSGGLTLGPSMVFGYRAGLHSGR
ncbi:hypothetical protein LTR84_005859 [Exophiala bonariae]|uniref:FAD-dependent oxidoreductase 2 FAD-binding domain-containing protein n=1 Tax=Exophiala bonariae TaxID=1690606 RepID=A0AAV9N277_9EURO|nr:hypothetical protein LTR84_005859 [Exophiala bonariae]